MMLTKNKITTVNLLIVVFFAVAFIELIAEFFLSESLVLATRIVSPLLLALIYKLNSQKNNPLVHVIFILMLVTNVIFFYENSHYFFLAVLITVVQRLVMLMLLFKLVAEKRPLSILLASVPFLIIFYYLNSITSEFSVVEFNTLFFQSILVSLLGGISLSAYLKNDNRQNSWLLISILLFVGLQFVVFIESYFSNVISLRVFGLIGIVLNTFGFFTFYKFVTAAEKEKPHV